MFDKNRINKDNIAVTFSFIVDRAWFFANSQYFRWWSDGESGNLTEHKYYDLEPFLTSDAPLKKISRYKEIVKYSDPTFPIENNHYGYASWDRNETEANKYEVVQFLLSRIDDILEDKLETRKFKRLHKVEIIKEYQSLTVAYKDKMVNDYNEMSEAQIIDLVTINPAIIQFIKKPSLEIRKAAYCGQYKGNDNHFVYNGEEYFTQQFKEALKKAKSIYPDIKKEDDLLIKAIEIDPLCAFIIIDDEDPFSKEVFNAAILACPEILFKCFMPDNYEHLILNEIAYDILEKEKDMTKFPDTVIKALQSGLALVNNNKNDNGNDVLKTRTTNLLANYYYQKNQISGTSYVITK